MSGGMETFKGIECASDANLQEGVKDEPLCFYKILPNDRDSDNCVISGNKRTDPKDYEDVAEDRDLYLQKWLDCFRNRNDRKSRTRFKCTIQVKFDPPDDETASLMWRLSVGKLLTLDEMEKLVIYIVTLKLKATENLGNQTRAEGASSHRNATSGVRACDPLPTLTPQPAQNRPCSPEIPVNPAPMIFINRIRSGGVTRQFEIPASTNKYQIVVPQNQNQSLPPSAKTPILITPNQLQSMANTNRFQILVPPNQPLNIVPSKQLPRIVPSNQALKMVAPKRSNTSPITAEPMKKAKASNVEENLVPVFSQHFMKPNDVNDIGRVSSVSQTDLGRKESEEKGKRKMTIMQCPRCNLRLTTNRLYKSHVNSCNGILVKPIIDPSNEGSCSQTEDAKQGRKCQECSEVLETDRDFELHMAIQHKYSWCYEFKSEEEYREWYHREGFDKAMVNITSRRHSKGDLQIIYSCAINQNMRYNTHTRTSAKRCPCQLVTRKVLNILHVTYFAIHNHEDQVLRAKYKRKPKRKFWRPQTGKAIFIKWPRTDVEDINERTCSFCGEVFSCVKDYEVHAADADDKCWGYRFANEEDLSSWPHEESSDETMYENNHRNQSKERIIDDKPRYPSRVVIKQEDG